MAEFIGQALERCGLARRLKPVGKVLLHRLQGCPVRHFFSNAPCRPGGKTEPECTNGLFGFDFDDDRTPPKVCIPKTRVIFSMGVDGDFKNKARSGVRKALILRERRRLHRSVNGGNRPGPARNAPVAAKPVMAVNRIHRRSDYSRAVG